MLISLQKKMKEQKGFTLVELLAVIVILGIIAAIAVPSIGNVINRSKDKATVQEGLQIVNAAKMYVANNGTLTFDINGNTTITQTNLTQYLDHVKAAAFTVTVNKDANGKLSYSLSGGHPAIPIANTTAGQTSASEQQLISAAE